MAYVPMDTEELKQLIMMGRKRPMNMAFNPGPKGADLLIIHRLKDPDVLGRTAKKEGEGTKVAKGSFEIDAKKLKLTVDKALPGLAKKFRKYLKELGFSFKVEVLDAQGNLLEEEDETEVAATAQSADQDAPSTSTPEAADAGPAINPADLATRLKALQAPIGDLTVLAAPLKKAAAGVVAQIKSGALEDAEASLSTLESAVKAAAKAQRGKEAKSTEAPAEIVPVEASPKALMARANSLRSAFDSAPGGGTVKAKKLLFEALNLLKNKDYDAANEELSKAEEALNDAAEIEHEPKVKSDVPRQKWDKTLAPLQVKVDAAMAAKTGDPDAINRAFNYALQQAEKGDFESALKSATTTINLLKEAATSAANARLEEAENAIPDNVARYTKSRLNWIDTRNRMQAELLKLKMTIDAQANAIEGLKELAENTDVLLDYIEELDTSLERVLEDLVETPDGPARDDLKAEARSIISSYRDTLDTEFFKAVDDNGFTPTTIRTTALNALAGVETALSA